MAFFLFPGRGNQPPGIGRDFYEGSKVVRDTLDEAEALCLPGLAKTLFDGPQEALTRSIAGQVGILVLQIAIARHMQARGHAASGCAGHSLGEVGALVTAGAVDFDVAVRHARLRAELTAELVPEGGMLAVLGLPATVIERVLPEDVQIANYNGPLQTVVSGTFPALQEAADLLKKAGAKRVIPLKVPRPFHCKHMAPAAEAFREALARAPVRAPRVRFISSVKGAEVSDPEELRDLIYKQFTSPVRWTEVMQLIGPVRAFELGPGRVLEGVAKRIEGAPLIENAGSLELANALPVEA